MKNIYLIFSMFLVLSCQSQKPQLVIFDTDIDSDIDDIGALEVLYSLQNQNIIKILGIIVTSNDPFAPTCVSVLNQYSGNESIPIGFLENQDTLKNHSLYTKLLTDEYPHSLQNYKNAYSSTDLYRKLLSKSNNQSVTIVTVGHLTSLQRLMQSPPDKISKLSGKKLIEQKVKKWYCMGGEYPKGKEANFCRPDPESTIYCLEHWTKPVVFCGWETGNKVITGGDFLKNNSDQSSPVFRGYQLYNNFAGRPSWDPLTVFLLSPRAELYFDFIKKGKCVVNPDGSNEWKMGKEQNHSYISLKNEIYIKKLASEIDSIYCGFKP